MHQRWRRTLPLAASAIFFAVAIRADGPAAGTATELRQKVQRLLTELDAESRSVRTAARDSLLVLGPVILPLLPKQSTLPSPAARDAVAQIRTRLERESALATLVVSRVTLQGRLPLDEILKWITEQTGNRFEYAAIESSLRHKEFTVNFQSRTFWSACDELIHMAGLVYSPLNKAGSIELLPAGRLRRDRELAVSDGGPFRLAVVSAALRPALGGPQKVLRITWSMMAEPRLRPLFASVVAKRLFATGSGSNAFNPLTPTARWELSMGEGSQALRLDSDFEVGAELQPENVEFRGSFAVEMAAGLHQFVFDDLDTARRQTQRAGTVAIGLRSVEFPPQGEKEGTARIEVSLVYDRGGPAFESYRTWMYHNEAALEAKRGNRLNPRPIISTRQQGDGSVAVEYNFADVPGTPRDYRFVYVAPTLITELPVEFRFPKIPVARAAEGEIKR